MSYRKITVDGKEYEYTIGHTHVKVKGVGVWPKEEVGEQFLKAQESATEFMQKYKDIPLTNGLESKYVDIRVQPSHIADKIRSLKWMIK